MVCTSLGQSFGQAQGRISGEGSQFQYSVRPDHAAEHFENPPLQMTRYHARAQVVEMGVSVERSEQLVFLVDVGQYVFFQFGRHASVSSMLGSV